MAVTVFDSFLDSHRVGPRLYSIGGKLTPISIRDQMIRAEMFVRRAIEAGLFQVPAADWPADGWQLIVVGGGAGGVAAALAAASYRIKTLVIDSAAAPFALQSRCPTRWLDPTIYDFPLGHWQLRQYPVHQGRIIHQLPWSAEVAQTIALHWDKDFRLLCGVNSRFLTFQPFSTHQGPAPLDASGNFLLVDVLNKDPGLPAPETKRHAALVVLLATGAGREKTYLRPQGQPPHQTWGLGFWERDDYQATGMGIVSGDAPRVLISGSGDGALQDLQRITTNCRAAELYDAAKLTPEQLCSLHSEQALALRSWQWGNHARHDHAVLKKVHDSYEKMVDHVLDVGGPAKLAELRKLLRTPFPTVRFVHDCTHFSHCYCINRYLALLILKLIQRLNPVLKTEGLPELDFQYLPQTRLADLQSLSTAHVCNRKARDCHGILHRVSLVKAPDCRQQSLAAIDGFDANVLILRHGVDIEDVKWDPTPQRARHLLPSYLLV